MPASQQHVTPHTPLGAHLVGEFGATFGLYAPAALAVYAVREGGLAAARQPAWSPEERDLLLRREDGTWTGFFPGVTDGARYRFWVVGAGSTGFKRDPYARELSLSPASPECDCVVRDPQSYPWHDEGYRPPEFRDLVLYQLHVGTFYALDGQGGDLRPKRGGKFLDLFDRVEHLRDLGVNAVEFLPARERSGRFAAAAGAGLFTPDPELLLGDSPELERYAWKAYDLLARRGHLPLTVRDLQPGINQLKAVIDLFHVHGIAVVFNVVLSRAGGAPDDQGLYFLDRRPRLSGGDGLYFAGEEGEGELLFDFESEPTRRLLTGKAKLLLEEYHADGLCLGDLSGIERKGGRRFLQEFTAALRYAKPQAVQIAGYREGEAFEAVLPPAGGLGFDAALAEGLRDRIREVVAVAAAPASEVRLGALGEELRPTLRLPALWRAVHSLEDHELLCRGERARLAALLDPGQLRSPKARALARVATGLLFSATGLPRLFMGQEILEERGWSEDFRDTEALIRWEALSGEKERSDHLRFLQDLIEVRGREAALRWEELHVFCVDEARRVLAFHRWLEGEGRDVVVTASFGESTCWDYPLGFPRAGRWNEVLNSDYYDDFPNPEVEGNFGAVCAGGPPLHGLPTSARVALPAHSLLVFAHERCGA
jgi:1,4-alpha-glucan branching enzyme